MSVLHLTAPDAVTREFELLVDQRAGFIREAFTALDVQYAPSGEPSG